MAFSLTVLAGEIPSGRGLGLVGITVWHEVKSGHVEESIGLDGISKGGGDSLLASWALGFIVEVDNNLSVHVGLLKSSSASGNGGGGEKNLVHLSVILN